MKNFYTEDGIPLNPSGKRYKDSVRVHEHRLKTGQIKEPPKEQPKFVQPERYRKKQMTREEVYSLKLEDLQSMTDDELTNILNLKSKYLQEDKLISNINKNKAPDKPTLNESLGPMDWLKDKSKGRMY
tara:strand:- start:573 stop:956 length:384 start_codon:yes stop_codon:yes gene_type:complete